MDTIKLKMVIGKLQIVHDTIIPSKNKARLIEIITDLQDAVKKNDLSHGVIKAERLVCHTEDCTQHHTMNYCKINKYNCTERQTSL